MKALLKGIRVVELAGLAPVPHCGLVLADAGAQVTVVERDNGEEMVEQRLIRGKEIVYLNLKSEEGLSKVKNLIKTSDVLLDPFRPGTLEKMGLDPVKLLDENKGLVICRLTGYGQNGPLAMEAGHDINYVALSGLMPTVSGLGKHPWPPVNLLADFAGGGLTAAFGIVTALLNRERNDGFGCIIDNSMVEGLSYLGTFVRQYYDKENLWTDPFSAFGGRCPIYRTYETKDGKYMAVGALEPKFTIALFNALGLDIAVSDVYSDPEGVIKQLEETFKTKTRDEWTKIVFGKDTCCTPVLDLHEAVDFPMHKARGAFLNENERWQAAAAPRYYSKEEFKKLKSNI